MQSKVAITVRRSRDEVERLWRDRDFHEPGVQDAQVRFADAPGDRGTEIHVDVGDAAGGPLKSLTGKLSGDDPRAGAKDDLRRFKALVETGEIPRSEGSPEGVLAHRQMHQRPAQPLEHLEHLGS